MAESTASETVNGVPILEAQTIRSWRKERRLSATALAERAGVTEMDVVRWENRKASPTLAMHTVLADVLQIPDRLRELMSQSTNGGRAAPNEPREAGTPPGSGAQTQRVPGTKSKLTEEEVIEIKQSLEVGYGDRELGEIYGVNPATIWHIRMGRTWRHVQA